MSEVQFRPSVTEQVRVEHGGADEPPPPSPPAPSSGSAAPYVAEELGKTARQTRRARYGTLVSLAILTAVAVGAVIAGLAADSAAFWTGASVVFYMALAAVIAFAANELGVVSKTADLLRAALKSESAVPADTVRADSEGSAEEARAQVAYELGQSLEKEGHVLEAEYAYRLAGEDDVDAMYALGRLLEERGELQDADRYLLLAAGAGDLEASRQLGRLHGQYGRAFGVPYEDFDGHTADNVVAAYVLERESAELERRGARVHLVLAGADHELSWSDVYELVRRLVNGPRYEASERLAPRIWQELLDQTGEEILLDEDDAWPLSHALSHPPLDQDSQLSSFAITVDEVAERTREAEDDEDE